MWQRLAFLGTGYGFIVLSYAWTWMLASAMAQCMPLERGGRLCKADVKAVLGMMALWTIVCAGIVTIDAWT